MKNILVTAIGSFSSDIVIKNLKKIGYRVVGIDIYPSSWVANSLIVDSFYQVSPASNEEEYIQAVQSICINERIQYVIPSTDIEIDVLDKYRDYFTSHGIVLCISSKETIAICRDKYAQYRYLNQSDLKTVVIPTKRLSDCNSCPFDYPVVCKPVNGRSSNGLCIIQTQKEWDDMILKRDRCFIVQPQIEGHVIAVDVIRDLQGTVVSVAREELLRTSNGAGTTVRVFSDPTLETYSKAIAQLFGVIGCVCIEFIQDSNGCYRFLECNPRFGGGVAFTCHSGYDCVINHISCFVNGQIESFCLQKEYYIARKYQEFITWVK